MTDIHGHSNVYSIGTGQPVKRPYDREFWLNLRLNYPAVAEAVRIITEARLEGKELQKRRPATILKLEVGQHIVEIKPGVSASPTGWQVSGKARIKVVTEGKGRTLKMKMSADEAFRPSRWSRRVEDNDEVLNAITIALDAMSAKPVASLTSRQGSCGLCGQYLSDDESRDRGIGPECWRRFEAIRGLLITPGGAA